MDKWEYKYEKIYISELTSFLKDFNKYGKVGGSYVHIQKVII